MSKIIRENRVKHPMKLILLRDLTRDMLSSYISHYLVVWKGDCIIQNISTVSECCKKVEPKVIFKIIDIEDYFFRIEAIYGRRFPDLNSSRDNNYGYIDNLRKCMHCTDWFLTKNERYIKKAVVKHNLYHYELSEYFSSQEKRVSLFSREERFDLAY